MNDILFIDFLILGMLTYIHYSFLNIRFKKMIYNILIYFGFVFLLYMMNWIEPFFIQNIFIFITLVCYSVLMFRNNIKDILWKDLIFYFLFSISQIFLSNRFDEWIVYKYVFYVLEFIGIFIFVRMKKEFYQYQYENNLHRIRYELLEQHYQSNFNFLHDLLNDCRTMVEYLENKEYTDLNTKINEVNETAYREFNAIYSNSPVLHCVIQSYKQILNENQIHIHTTIEYVDFSFMSLYDQTEFFSLLIDYGIECCKHVVDKEKNIIIKSKVKNDQVIIQMLTSSSFDLTHESLSRLEEFICHYNATISMKYNQDNNVMSCILVFHIQK